MSTAKNPLHGLKVSLIAAMGRDQQLGQQNKLLWHIPEDFKIFKRFTMGQTMVMGRKTYESIGKPLPGRTTWILSKQTNLALPDGVKVFSCWEEIGVEAKKLGLGQLMICGGAEIYTQTLPWAHELLLSFVDYTGPADTFFPKINFLNFHLVEEVAYPQLGLSFTFRRYQKLA